VSSFGRVKLFKLIQTLFLFDNSTFMMTRIVPVSGHDTVGAVAMDVNGKIATATSTGGITGKRVGRVGDSPLIGTEFPFLFNFLLIKKKITRMIYILKIISQK